MWTGSDTLTKLNKKKYRSVHAPLLRVVGQLIEKTGNIIGHHHAAPTNISQDIAHFISNNRKHICEPYSIGSKRLQRLLIALAEPCNPLSVRIKSCKVKLVLPCISAVLWSNPKYAKFPRWLMNQILNRSESAPLEKTSFPFPHLYQMTRKN